MGDAKNKRRLNSFGFVVLLILLNHLAFADWTPRKFVADYLNWDYWWLNTRIGIDSFDTLYCAVARFNYSSMNDIEHDLYILNSDGDVIRTLSPWHGYEYQPIVQDAAGNNIYLSQAVVGLRLAGNCHMDWGVTDDSNQIHSTRGGEWGQGVYYSKLASDGSIIYGNVNIYAGFPSPGKNCMAIDSRNYLYMVWGDSSRYLVYAKSTDGGAVWIFDTLRNERVSNQPKVICDPNNNIHFIWRTWTTDCKLHYLKLRADGSCAVDNSIFASSINYDTWDPQIALDVGNNIHVVYTSEATNNHEIYYTVITGNLDKNGQPATDSELTIVSDTVIQYDAVGLAYPKITIDSLQQPHVIFEQGQYGTNTNKAVYHIKGDPVIGINEDFMSSPQKPVIFISPNPFSKKTNIRLQTTDNRHAEGEGNQDISESVRSISEYQQPAIKIFDATGRLVKSFSLPTSVSWDGTDDLGCRIPSGVYFIHFVVNSVGETGEYTKVKKAILLR